MLRTGDVREGGPLTDLSLSLPPEALEQLADLVANRMSAWVTPRPEPYMDAKEAAYYIGYRGDKPSKKMSELALAGKVRGYRDGANRIFKRADLDTYVEASTAAAEADRA